MRIITEAARRIAETITQASADGQRGRWIAFNLADGRPRRERFLLRSEAVTHYPDHHLYILVPPDGMSPEEAETTLRFHRDLHDAGYTTADPNFAPLPMSFERSPLGL